MAQPSKGSRNVWWTLAQIVAIGVALLYAWRALSTQWSGVQAVARQVHVQWRWMLLSGCVVVIVHASLVQSWRMLVTGWGSTLGFGAAVRIWTISNLGKYLPFKVGSIAAMGILTQREGASGISAIGAAILGALLNLGAGFGVVALGGASVLRTLGVTERITAIIGSVIFVLGVAMLPWILPPLLTRIARWRGLPPLQQHLRAQTIWIVTTINVLAWIGYGIAFMALSRALTPQIAGTPMQFIAVYTVSYIIGYLYIFAPGGVVVRETVMTGLLVSFGLALQPDAIFLALASRVWLTVIEVLPGLISLLIAPAIARVPVRRVD